MLEGKVSDFSLPEIFQLIALTKKTGTLRVATSSQVGHVRFRDGEVCEAASDTRRLALGARLVAIGLVDEGQLAAALEAKRDRGGEVLRLLLEHAEIDEGALHAFVREQIADAVADMLRFEDATFRFDSDDMPDEPLIAAKVATDQLVTEGNQRLAEWDAIRQHVPSDGSVFALVPAPGIDGNEVTVDVDAWQILALVDGRRSVRDIVDLSGRSEFTTSKLLARLAARKLVEPCGRGDAEGGPLSSLMARREVLRRLEDLELSELRSGPSRPAPATERSDPEPASRETLGLGRQEGPQKPVPPREAMPPAPAVGRAEAVPAIPDSPEPVPAPAGNGEQVVPPPAEIDRAQVARELAALGLDGPGPDSANRNGASAGGAGGEEQVVSKRLVRDEEINKGLLLRLIDGVKGA